MDYEKKYKETLNKAKELITTSVAFDRFTIETIFPELKETKDDRIKKDIIWCLKNAGIKDDSPINPHVTTIMKDAIAWLKKQGEQKPQGKTALKAISEEKVDNANKVENETEIPYGAKDSELIEESYYIPKGFHAEIDEDKVVIKKGEKPTAWSVDDDAYKVFAISAVKYYYDGDNPLQKHLVDWLKSIKGRVGCEANCTTTKEWKPSDEQMTTLRQVISGCSYDIEPLVEMEEQLKKLRGE